MGASPTAKLSVTVRLSILCFQRVACVLGGEKQKCTVAVCTLSCSRHVPESLACSLCVIVLGQSQGSPLTHCRQQCPRSASIHWTSLTACLLVHYSCHGWNWGNQLMPVLFVNQKPVRPIIAIDFVLSELGLFSQNSPAEFVAEALHQNERCPFHTSSAATWLSCAGVEAMRHSIIGCLYVWLACGSDPRLFFVA